MDDILVLYYSRFGATEALAREICEGVDSVGGASARLRTVPAVSTTIAATASPVPSDGPPFATKEDLREASPYGAVAVPPTE